MATADIIRVDPDDEVEKGGDAVEVTVTVDNAWFGEPEDLGIKFIFSETLQVTEFLSVYGNITVDNSTVIRFSVRALEHAELGGYYVRVKNFARKEIVTSGPEDGVIVVR